MEELKLWKADKSIYEQDYRDLWEKFTDLNSRFINIEKEANSYQTNIQRCVNLSIDTWILDCF